MPKLENESSIFFLRRTLCRDVRHTRGARAGAGGRGASGVRRGWRRRERMRARGGGGGGAAAEAAGDLGVLRAIDARHVGCGAEIRGGWARA